MFKYRVVLNKRYLILILIYTKITYLTSPKVIFFNCVFFSLLSFYLKLKTNTNGHTRVFFPICRHVNLIIKSIAYNSV